MKIKHYTGRRSAYYILRKNRYFIILGKKVSINWSSLTRMTFIRKIM